MAFSLLFYGKISLHVEVNVPMSMTWNVFLALLAYDFAYFSCQVSKKGAQIGFAFLWLIFYPNTFYVLTDAKHFVDWLDPTMVHRLSQFRTLINFNLLIFGIIFGVVLGAWSIQLIVTRFVPYKVLRAFFVFVISFLSSIGIFVGRSEQLRLNSWDLILHPFNTFFTIIRSINQENLGFFGAFTVCQIVIILLLSFSPQLFLQKK
ncbi:DUF1361 domain-containing protein [Lactococcus hircilactis]